MSDSNHIVCPHCHGVNRVGPDRDPRTGRCGKCKNLLFTGQPLTLDSAGFDIHLTRSDLPLVVDFWAAWCGPCKMMAPAFQAAAAHIEPAARLAKLDTEAHPGIAGRYHIRSIPTLILFRRGREAARVSGAMDRSGLTAWIRQHL